MLRKFLQSCSFIRQIDPNELMLNISPNLTILLVMTTVEIERFAKMIYLVESFL